MKTIKNLLSIFVFISSFMFVSCEDEPVDATLVNNTNTNNTGGGGNTGGTNVIGTYKLTAYNSSVPTDLNNDGTNSTNQLNETTCFNNMFLVLNSNHTFNADSKGIDIDLAGTGTECFTDPDYNGSWVLNGTTLTLTYVDTGVTYVDNYNVSGNTLNTSVSNGEVVGMVGGQPVYLTANLQIIYTKQ